MDLMNKALCCAECGSTEITIDAQVRWNPSTNKFEDIGLKPEDLLWQDTFCAACEESVAVVAKEVDLSEDRLYRLAAEEKYYSEGYVEIDDNAVVSRGDDDGAYVQAWVWVEADAVEREREAGA